MPNQPVNTSLDALAVGRTGSDPFVQQFEARDPTPYDLNFPIQKLWLNTGTNTLWELKNFVSANGITTAHWIKIGGSNIVETLTGNNTSVQVPPSSDSDTPPNNINVIGDGTFITVTGDIPTHTLTISPAGGLATVYVEDIGTASPAGGFLNVLGGTGIQTVGSGDTITINATPFAYNYVQIATVDSPYTVTGIDYFISCNSAAGPITILLPNAPAAKRIFVIKDRTASASGNHINITTVSGAVTIDGMTTYLLTSNYGAVNLLFNGTSYEVF